MKNVLLYIMLESKIATVLSLVDCAEHLLDTGEDCPMEDKSGLHTKKFNSSLLMVATISDSSTYFMTHMSYSTIE